MDRLVAPRVRIVLQARTNSSRLPGKVLLPLAGMPIVLLAARRARGAHHLRVATSVGASDDELAEVLKVGGFPVTRGALDDVLGRFVLATRDLAGSDVCVRLTADNVLPDASFVTDLVGQLMGAGATYARFGTDLPYGLSAEAFRVDALRAADRAASTAHDREHVTSWLLRSCDFIDARPKQMLPADLRQCRCTIDTQEDYRAMVRLFEGVEDAVCAPWLMLARRLEPANRATGI